MFVEVLLEAILDGLTAVGAVELLSRGLGSYLLPLLGRKTRDVGRGGGRDRSRTGGGAAAEGRGWRKEEVGCGWCKCGVMLIIDRIAGRMLRESSASSTVALLLCISSSAWVSSTLYLFSSGSKIEGLH
jgi:hypothetical protein